MQKQSEHSADQRIGRRLEHHVGSRKSSNSRKGRIHRIRLAEEQNVWLCRLQPHHGYGECGHDQGRTAVVRGRRLHTDALQRHDDRESRARSSEQREWLQRHGAGFGPDRQQGKHTAHPDQTPCRDTGLAGRRMDHYRRLQHTGRRDRVYGKETFPDIRRQWEESARQRRLQHRERRTDDGRGQERLTAVRPADQHHDGRTGHNFGAAGTRCHEQGDGIHRQK